MGRTDYYILYDPDLCFREILRRHTAGEPLITKEEKEELKRKFYKGEEEEEGEGKEEEEEEDEVKSEEAQQANTTKAPDETEEDKKEKDDVKKEEESKPTEGEDANVNETSEEIEDESKSELDLTEKVQGEEEDEDEAQKCEEKIDSKSEEIDKKESDERDGEEMKEEKENEATTNEETEAEAVKSEIAENEWQIKEEKEEKSEGQLPSKEVKDSKDIIPTPPLLSLQQMDEAMSKMGSGLTIDSLAANEPTVAQLLAQSAANPIKWPKDRVLQTRLEHMMYAVEHKKWPVPIDFQSSDHDLLGSSKCDTPPSAPSTPTGPHPPQELLMMEAEKRKRRHLEEVERAHLQAMLHPNLHHNMALSKVPHTTAAAAAAAAAALGFSPGSFSVSNLRSLIEANESAADKKTQSMLADSHTHALRQLQALQGSLDLTIKPVSSQSLEMGVAGYLNRRGPGRPRLDDPLLKGLCQGGGGGEKRRTCESPQDKSQDKKRRKLDDIVMGLSSSKGKGPDDAVVKEANNPLALLKGSSVTLLTSRDKAQVTPAVTAPKLSSSISITPTNMGKFPGEAKGDTHSPGKSGFGLAEKEAGSKPGLVKSSDLPPGISLPPGIELYRPTDSAKVDKWLEQHQDLLNESKSSSPREHKRRKIDFSSLDWSQFSGDEHVPVINSTSGQKVCSKGF